MILDDLRDKLTSQGVATTAELYVHDLPSTPDELLSLHLTAGGPVERAMSAGPGTGQLERPHVQLRVRAGHPMTAYKRAQDAYNALDHLGPVTINGVLYHHVVALQSPFFLEEDLSGRYLYVCNFEVLREIATSS